MFKLSPLMSQKHKSLVSIVQEANENAESAIENFNDEVSSMFKSDVAPVIEKLNTALENLRNFCSEVNDEAQEYYDEQSEEWHDSDESNDFHAWMSVWDAGTGIYDLEVDEPQELTFEAVDFFGVDDVNDSP